MEIFANINKINISISVFFIEIIIAKSSKTLKIIIAKSSKTLQIKDLTYYVDPIRVNPLRYHLLSFRPLENTICLT